MNAVSKRMPLFYPFNMEPVFLNDRKPLNRSFDDSMDFVTY